MKAAILTAQKAPLEIAKIEIPSLLQYGQVLVKVFVSGICGSQVGEIDGVKGPDRFMPHLLGHEGSGIVIDTGPGVTKVKKDDKVVLHWRKGTGIESTAPKYRWGDRTVNAGWVTTFNEYAIVSENRVTPFSGDVDFEVAALMGCAVTTGFGVICNDARLRIGESIAVFGAGGVGLNEIQCAALVSADPIIAIDIYEHKLELARRLGATHTINSKKGDPKEEILRIAGKRGVDVAIDNTGNTKVIELAYEITSSTGRTILVGVPKKNDKISIYSLPLHFDKILKGSHGGGTEPSEDIPRYLNLYKKGRLNLKDTISHRFSLDDINLAIDTLRSGEAIRCILRVAD